MSLNFLENDGELSDEWWEQSYKEIEEHKKAMYGKLNWTPWGHVDQLKKYPDFVRKLFRHGEVSKSFLMELGINISD